MHVTTLLTLSTLGGITQSLSLPRPQHLQDSSTTRLQALNTSRTWPRAPFLPPINQNSFVAITGYGRHVCLGRVDCEDQVRTDINLIGWDVIMEYKPSASHAYSFTSGGVNFCIKQEKATDNAVVLKVIHALHDLTREYGTTELVKASIVNEREVVARFMLTFPGL